MKKAIRSPLQYYSSVWLSATSVIILLSIILTLGACPAGFEEPAPSKDEGDITVTAAGGNFEFPDGLQLSVPAGALGAPATIDLRLTSQADFEFAFGSGDVRYRCGVTGGNGLVLAAPATLTLPLPPDYPAGTIPLVYAFDLATETGLAGTFTCLVDPAAGTLSLTVSRLDTLAVLTDPALLVPVAASPAGRSGFGSRQTLLDPVSTTESSEGYAGSGADDNSAVVDGEISWPDNPTRPAENWHFEEAGTGCAPAITISADSTSVLPGTPVVATAKVTLGRRPLPSRNVSFVAVGAAGLQPLGGATGTTGTIATTVTAGAEEGRMTVTAGSRVRWHLKRIVINDEVQVDEWREAEVGASVDILVFTPPVLTLSPASATLAGNGEIRLEAAVSRGGQTLGDIAMNFSLAGPGTLVVNTATTTTGAPAAATYYAASDNGEAKVTASCTVPIIVAGTTISLPLSARAALTIEEVEVEVEVERWSGTLTYQEESQSWAYYDEVINYTANFEFSVAPAIVGLEGEWRQLKGGGSATQSVTIEPTQSYQLVNSNIPGSLELTLWGSWFDPVTGLVKVLLKKPDNSPFYTFEMYYDALNKLSISGTRELWFGNFDTFINPHPVPLAEGTYSDGKSTNIGTLMLGWSYTVTLHRVQ